MIKTLSPPRLYLEPLDLLPRPSRPHADSVPALGGAVSALSIGIWRPDTPKPRTVLAAGELPAWLDTLDAGERAICDLEPDATCS